MVFSSIAFIFYYLPAVIVLYFLAPYKFKNFILFIFSLIFYAWGEPIYVVLMLFSTVADYSYGLMIEKYLNLNERKKAKAILICSIVTNLATLGFFKYADFMINNINLLLNTDIGTLNLALPIGISFYTFQTMSYSIDVYRGQAKAQKNIISFGTYVTLFPQLIAGPIVRFKTIADELDKRRHSIERFSRGALRFTIGLGKKVILANNAGYIWDTVIKMNIDNMSIVTSWIGIISFSFQIYFDFSGYSDMAIGLGDIFGFTFPENFNYPYISKSITEFWRRWHISLGVWFKEYVYIPMGGSRKDNRSTMINIAVVWILTGLWHGASWNFVLWGIYFMVIIVLEKLFILKILNRAPSVIAHAYALFFIIIGWTIFSFEDISYLSQYLLSMMGLNGGGIFIDSSAKYILSSNYILFILLTLGSTPIPKMIYNKAEKIIKSDTVTGVFQSLFIIVIMIISTAYIINSSYNPFLYFRF